MPLTFYPERYSRLSKTITYDDYDLIQVQLAYVPCQQHTSAVISFKMLLEFSPHRISKASFKP